MRKQENALYYFRGGKLISLSSSFISLSVAWPEVVSRGGSTRDGSGLFSCLGGVTVAESTEV